eukprot:TRINITY_DN6361_c0_g3_i1.p4 TRINITY_DN6361_c0_g3~~TRINITY_DN6361_c0_g3_i1.p4  ORF type:complete len:123 (-),score=11.92 TRINITY_DN6361_c0_g3_i1:15-383(-)
MDEQMNEIMFLSFSGMFHDAKNFVDLQERTRYFISQKKFWVNQAVDVDELILMLFIKLHIVIQRGQYGGVGYIVLQQVGACKLNQMFCESSQKKKEEKKKNWGRIEGVMTHSDGTGTCRDAE